MPEATTANLSPRDLERVLTTVIDAARKPVLTEEEMSHREQTRQSRLAHEEINRKKREQLTLRQQVCSHKHSARENNASFCVLVNDSINQYIFCQQCQIMVKPGVAPQENPGRFVYSTDMFNRLLQESR